MPHAICCAPPERAAGALPSTYVVLLQLVLQVPNRYAEILGGLGAATLEE
jgi:hypothetical protein